MPDTARVYGDGKCPNCSEKVVNYVRIQWGVMPNETYQLGDEVKWLRDGNGQALKPFTLYSVGKGDFFWNSGTPVYQNVIAFDVLFDVDVSTMNFMCPACGVRILGSAAVIEGGKFKDILAFDDAGLTRVLGQSRGRADIVIAKDDGTFWPREDWDDVPLEMES